MIQCEAVLALPVNCSKGAAGSGPPRSWLAEQGVRESTCQNCLRKYEAWSSICREHGARVGSRSDDEETLLDG